MRRWYVGTKHNWQREAFPALETPTAAGCPQYKYCVGPFRTKRAALWLQAHPGTTLQTVSELERIAAQPERPAFANCAHRWVVEYNHKHCSLCGAYTDWD